MGANATVLDREFHAALSQRFVDVTPSLRSWLTRRRAVAGAGFEIEDVVQEVWLRALTTGRRYQPQVASFRAWLLGIAANVLLELRRGDLRLRVGEPAEGGTTALRRLDELPAAATTVLSRVSRRERLQNIVACIGSRDTIDSRVFQLRAIDGRSHQAVARLSGLSVEAAMKRWQRLLQELRDSGQLRRLLLD